ncbi:MAG: NAD(P)H-binding protein [Syntrophothermus sp.]
MKTAIVIGATGLVGTELVKQLLVDARYSKVKIFVRKDPQIDNRNLETYVIDFDKIEDYKNQFIGDDLFSAMGTTLKTAGSQEKQYVVDFTYQYKMAELCAANGVKQFLLVSTIGASSSNAMFYLKMKGELEDKVQELPFEHILIFRPSLLKGERKGKKRIMETISEPIFGFLTKIFLRKFTPIDAKQVAASMIAAANMDTQDKVRIFESSEMQLL